MRDDVDVAVVGAGPYGLSVAAWLADRRTRVFGAAMRTWRTLMPPQMLLRSAWEESSLSARAGRGTIDEFAAAAGVSRREPIPLQLFLDYADWFRAQFVADHDPADVTLVEPADDGFRIHTATGDVTSATHVVVAVGATPFVHAPRIFADAVGDNVSFVNARGSFERFGGRRVVIVGAGQSGLEAAALAAQAGADVEVLARSRVHWFADHEPHHARSRRHGAVYRLAYPVVGYGPPPLNRLTTHPDLFAALPWAVRDRLTKRMLRPGGSPWLRGHVEGHVGVSEGVTVVGLETSNGIVTLRLSDGASREADHVLLATGFRFRLERLPWLDESLRARIDVHHGWPVLDRAFRSTVPGIRFVGYPAEGRFGPLLRFVLGTRFAAERVAETLAPRETSVPHSVTGART